MTRNLSVFFPCINEEGNIENTVSGAEKVLKQLKVNYEIIIVDDGSGDSTGKIADKLAAENPNVRVIHHPKNLGYGEALKSGFYNARFDTIVYSDGDGQFDFQEVTKFLEKISDYDLIIGYRIKRRDSFLRRLFGRGWRLTLLSIFGVTLKDVDCGFKMVSKKVLEKIPHLKSSRGAMINAELAIKAKKAGFKIAQVGVNHYPRVSGKPTGANLQVIIKSYVDLLKLWWELKNYKGLFILLLGVLALAAFLRFYKLSEYMTFLGDEGRDAIVIKNMLTEHHFPLIGPPTSVGNIYLGPLYYYMMAPPMIIFNLNPAAAAGMNAAIGVLVVGLIYYFGKVWFGRAAGIVAAYLYAISPVAIIYSRSSWNPNPAPFFSLIAIFGLYKAYKSDNYKWLILTGLSSAAAIQMHYLVLILLPVLLIGWLIELFRKNQQRKNFFWTGTILAIASFFLMMSPLLMFDLRHDFLNYKALTHFLNNGAVTVDIFANVLKIPYLYSYNLIGRYIAGENPYLTGIISLLTLIVLFYKFSYWPKTVLGVWLIVGLFGLTFYQQNIYDHYLGFLSPIPFLLLGSVAVIRLPASKYLPVLILAVLILFLTVVNFQRNPLLTSGGNQLKRTQDIAKFIIYEAGDRDFNFALLAKNNYDSAYQFYLDMYGHKPKQVPFNKTDQLFVVCEDEVCDPTHSPKYELAAFGWSKIAWEQNLYGVKIYKLIPNPSGKP